MGGGQNMRDIIYGLPLIKIVEFVLTCAKIRALSEVWTAWGRKFEAT